jgi:Protein of unknown function DUF2625
MTTSAWDEVSSLVGVAPYPVTVLAPDSQRAAQCLNRLGITTHSWLGAVISNTGGLLVDHGWLRVLGSGTNTLPDILVDADATQGRLTVAYDVLGGQFVWAPANDTGTPTIHYFAPDDLDWQDLGQGYADWLHAVLTGSLDQFYETLRWPGWQQEIATVRPDQGIHTWPPPWSSEGTDPSAVSRKVIALAELVSFHHHTAQQLNNHET